ncbi:unnamed protein product [Nesidiocoris tenuis]|uniref:Uncharacterized protein n=1 Tax=Nesidiocoris tenuis TaxID=355587 RepID=A0A6H5G3Y5_9HEMI|nr:unnamed protein product [Nesidiocoris tenuis]
MSAGSAPRSQRHKRSAEMCQIRYAAQIENILLHERSRRAAPLCDGRTAEEEIEKRIKDMGTKLKNTTEECKKKRDQGQWLLREVCWKVMAQMDKEIDRTLQNKRTKPRRGES